MTTAKAREAKVIGGFNNLADRFQRWYSGSIPWSDVELAKVALIAAVRAEERERTIRETLDKHINCMPEDDALYAWLLLQRIPTLDTPPANAHIPSPSTRDVQC